MVLKGCSLFRDDIVSRAFLMESPDVASLKCAETHSASGPSLVQATLGLSKNVFEERSAWKKGCASDKAYPYFIGKIDSQKIFICTP